MSTEETRVVKFNITEAAIAKMAEQFLPLKINGIDDTVGYATVEAARLKVKRDRCDVEAMRKDLKADALKWGRYVDSEAARVTGLLEPIESHLKAEQDRIDAEKEKLRLAEEEKARQHLQSRLSTLSHYDCYPTDTVWLVGLSDDEFEEHVKTARYAFETKKAAEEAEIAKKRAEKEAQEAEKAKLEALKADLDRRAKEIEEKERKHEERLNADKLLSAPEAVAPTPCLEAATIKPFPTTVTSKLERAIERSTKADDMFQLCRVGSQDEEKLLDLANSFANLINNTQLKTIGAMEVIHQIRPRIAAIISHIETQVSLLREKGEASNG